MVPDGISSRPEFEVRTQLVNIDAVASHALQTLLFQADREGRYLNDWELLQIGQLRDDPDLIETLKTLRDESEDIVNTARRVLLTMFPSLTEPGGGLYPPTRATACWRDLWHFLRCMTYGIALGQPSYTNPHGLDRLRQLYQKLKVPLDAMVVGLEAVRDESLARLTFQQAARQKPYFNHLIDQMRSFQEVA
ncbi:MAG TPA: phycobilisome protein [Trichocoleus sp.]